MELCCLTQSRLDVSFKKGCKSQWNARIRENRFLFQKTWKPNKQLQHLLNLIRVFISQQLCICEYITVILAKREWLKMKMEVKTQSPVTELIVFCWHDGQIISGLVPTLPNKMSFHKQQPDACVVCVKLCVCVSVSALLYSPETLKSPSGSQAILWAWWRNVGEKRRMIINGFILRRQPST